MQRDAIKSGRNLFNFNDSKTLRLYAPAVSALRHALGDRDESVAAETLFAAFLLCCFDVWPPFSNTFAAYLVTYAEIANLIVIPRGQFPDLQAPSNWYFEDHPPPRSFEIHQQL